jgi:adenylate cyclase
VPLLARTRLRDRGIPGSGSLMDRCLAAGLPVASSCSGRGACGRCAVEVLEGGEALTTASLREERVLSRNGLGAPMRLACQCRVRHSTVTVTVRAGYW